MICVLASLVHSFAGVLGGTSVVEPAPVPTHEVEYRVHLVDPAAGRLTVEARFLLVHMPDPFVLEDRGAAFFSPERGLPVLSQTARPQAGDPVFRDQDGTELSAEVLDGGRWSVPTGGGRFVSVTRELVIPDRTSGVTAAHPFASTLSATSAALLGLDLFLSPAHDLVQLGAPTIRVHMISEQKWQWQSPFGRGRTLQVPSYVALQDNFLMAGPDLVVRSVRLQRQQVSVVASQADFQDVDSVLTQATTLVAEAGATFGPLAPGAYVVALQPLRETSHRRVISQRGASTPRTVLAYADAGSSTAYAEHPLSVVGHEVAHWWNPRAMSFEKGIHAPWFTEGITTYYELLLLLRTGVVELDFFAQAMADQWERDRTMAGARRFNLETASAHFHEDSVAQQVVYRRGALLGFLLDTRLRAAGNSLDELMQRLLTRGRRNPGRLRPRAILEEVHQLGGEALVLELRDWLAQSEPLALEEGLSALGYDVEMKESPLLGVGLAVGDVPVVRSVHPRGPCADKLRVSDVIVELAGHPVTSVEEFRAAIDDCTPGQEIVVRVLRGAGEQEVPILVGTRRSPMAVPRPANPGVRQFREDLRRSHQVE